jgi:hypothetical protein
MQNRLPSIVTGRLSNSTYLDAGTAQGGGFGNQRADMLRDHI